MVGKTEGGGVSKCAVCAIAACGRVVTVKQVAAFGFHCFFFSKNRVVRAQWLQRCGRRDSFDPDNAKVCPAHFLSTAYDPLYVVKKKLLPDACAALREGIMPTQLVSCSEGCTYVDGSSQQLVLVVRLTNHTLS